MWMKETRETLRQTAFVMSFFVLVPLMFLLDISVYRTGMTLTEYLSNGMDLFIMITALYLAYNMFKPEEEDGATEYLLSLPIGRMRLLAVKVLPRVAGVLILVLAGWVLYGILLSGGSALGCIFMNWRSGLVYMILLMVFIQGCGFTLGLVGRTSWSARVILLFMVVSVWQLGTFTILIHRFLKVLFDWTVVFNFFLALRAPWRAFIDFAVFYLLLWYILRPLMGKWDGKSFRLREIWFQRRAVLPLVLFLVLLLNRQFSNFLIGLYYL